MLIIRAVNYNMKIPLIITLLILSSFHLYAQGVDSLRLNLPDSAAVSPADSLAAADTTGNNSYGVDTVIYASASDSLFFYVNKKRMDIYGKADIKYQQTDLKSANIFVDFQTNRIQAEGIPSDTAEGGFAETPVLKEGSEVYEGKRMTYNYKSQQGYISMAGTEEEGAYYGGEKIKKVDKETYFVKDGTYTTCDLEHPHYWFYASEMKVIQKSQVAAKWIWLYLGGVPFPIPIPFAVFPIQSGRRSGILPPAFGDDATYGRYFSRFGYFWAISDYMDWNITADYFTRGSYRLGSRFRYAKRYNFSGNFNGNYSDMIKGLPSDPDRSEQIDWRLSWSHHQDITPSMRFDANLDFASGNYFQRNVTDLSQYLNKEIISTATFNKSWEESGTNLSVSYRRRQVLGTGEINETLPSLTFTKSQAYPFKSGVSSGKQKWYELIGYSYSGQFLNKRDKIKGNLKIRGGIKHNFTVNASPKIGYFNIAPNINYEERWYNKRIEKYVAGTDSSGNDSIATKDIHQINLVHSFRTGITASTKLFGMFQPNLFGITAVRHTLTPSLSYSYQPDFSRPFWDYYGSYKKSDGEVVYYDKFGNEVFGGPGSGEQQNLSFSLGNNFEMKLAPDPTDTTSKEKKLQLLNVSANINYNMAADSLKFYPISLSYRTQIGEWLSFNGNSSFSLYDWDENGRLLNKYLINEGKGLLRMTSFGINLSTSLSGEKLKSLGGAQQDQNSEQQEDEFAIQEQQSVYQGIYQEKEADFTIPWSISLNYYYQYSKTNPVQANKTSNINASIDFNLTKSWKFSFTGSYDFIGKQFGAPQIRISKDLHCWLMNFTWNPIGLVQGYRFEIRVKAPQLQDLKLTKRSNFYSGR